MSRKQPKRRAGNVVFGAMAGIFILAIICGVGFGVASADSADDAARAGAFGLSNATTSATAGGAAGAVTAPLAAASPAQEFKGTYREQSVLASTSKRYIDSGLKMIDEREKEERERAAAEAAAERKRAKAENAAALKRVGATKAMQGVEQGSRKEIARNAKEGVREYDLPAVDWTVGQDAFVEEWASRIDAYLKKSPLAGCGRVFAEAAWDNGVDPRWSPAISCTESGKGEACFMPHNAWGWGDIGWSDWETAIRDHVAGLAEGYGYSITLEAAAKYCPPNTDHWYTNTLSQMASI